MVEKIAMDVVFLSYEDLPEGDPDDNLALAELTEMGLRCKTIDWRGDHSDLVRAKVMVLRSCWNYHKHFEEFCAKLEAFSRQSLLLNPLALVLPNLHKSYLLRLAERGVRICPTYLCKQGEQTDLSSLLKLTSGYDAYIVKPAIGLATSGVAKFRNGQDSSAALIHIETLLKVGDCLVQPYFNAVEGEGEKSLVYINGVFSHCVRKAPFQILAAAGHAGESPSNALPEQLELAQLALSTLSETPLYARVDVVRQDGVDYLMELELTEPSLFLSMKDGSAALLARAIADRISSVMD